MESQTGRWDLMAPRGHAIASFIMLSREKIQIFYRYKTGQVKPCNRPSFAYGLPPSLIFYAKCRFKQANIGRVGAGKCIWNDKLRWITTFLWFLWLQLLLEFWATLLWKQTIKNEPGLLLWHRRRFCIHGHIQGSLTGYMGAWMDRPLCLLGI